MKTKKISPTKAKGHMRGGAGWRLVSASGSAVFAATLILTINLHGNRLAIFSVPKRRRGQ